MNKGGDEKNGVRVQVADPNLVVKKKALEERMDRNSKAPPEEIFKNNILTGAGVGVAFPFWRPPAAELLVMKQTHPDEIIEGPRAALGLLPLLCH